MFRFREFRQHCRKSEFDLITQILVDLNRNADFSNLYKCTKFISEQIDCKNFTPNAELLNFVSSLKLPDFEKSIPLKKNRRLAIVMKYVPDKAFNEQHFNGPWAIIKNHFMNDKADIGANFTYGIRWTKQELKKKEGWAVL